MTESCKNSSDSVGKSRPKLTKTKAVLPQERAWAERYGWWKLTVGRMKVKDQGS